MKVPSAGHWEDWWFREPLKAGTTESILLTNIIDNVNLQKVYYYY